MNAKEMKAKINSGEFDEAFRRVYVTDEAVALQKPRYVKLIETFEEIFGGERDICNERSRQNRDLRQPH